MNLLLFLFKTFKVKNYLINDFKLINKEMNLKSDKIMNKTIDEKILIKKMLIIN
jgi:hypothetical protein